ncbi:MAG: NmrA family NAD(P)-binding protein, partial [Desulfobacterales bacterium]|nr:NmrA family NAD(P)-binding protein [Desulfobacterales bacterium]
LFVIPPPLNPKQHELIIPMIDMAVQSGVRHIVNISTMSVAHIGNLPLATAEQYIEKSGIAYTLLRPNWFMQNCNGYMSEGIRKNGAINLPAGDAKTSLIDIRDIAEVSVAALTTENHLNRKYTLTGGKALDNYEIAEILSDVTGKEIQYYPMADDDMRLSLKSLGMTDENVEMYMDLYRSVRKGDTASVLPDAANVLGREPITFKQYANDYIESWK